MLDDTAKKIIGLLSDNSRVSNKEIADELGISEGTVRNRIKNLVDNGNLKLAGLIAPDKYTEKQLIMLGVNIAASKDLQKTAEEISSFQEVKSVSITTGRYDLLVELWVDVKYGLIAFLSDSLSQVKEIVATESFVIMKSYNKWI